MVLNNNHSLIKQAQISPVLRSSEYWWRHGVIYDYQSVPITINVVSLNPTNGKVYSIQLYVIKFVSDLQLRSVVISRYSGFLHQ